MIFGAMYFDTVYISQFYILESDWHISNEFSKLPIQVFYHFLSERFLTKKDFTF